MCGQAAYVLSDLEILERKLVASEAKSFCVKALRFFGQIRKAALELTFSKHSEI